MKNKNFKLKVKSIKFEAHNVCDYSEKAFCVILGNGDKDFIAKNVIENKIKLNVDTFIFTVPYWVFKRLKGKYFYKPVYKKEYIPPSLF